MDADQHPHRPHLHQLLQERLPQLGLDAEMYGPYVWGDDEDSDNDDDDKDVDELRELVVGVLQASSETHSEDDGVWEELIENIQSANKEDSRLRREKREKHLLETKTKMEEDLAKAKLEEQEQPHGNEEKKKSSQVDDEQKKILMQRYGYDEPAEDEGGSGFGGNSSGASKKQAAATAGVVNNKDAAKAAYAEKSKEVRGAQKTTKAEERKKTKEQRANKAQLKEARRKKSQKGERKA